jgi:hypothetical protein
VRFYISPGTYPEGAVAEMNKRYEEYATEVK